MAVIGYRFDNRGRLTGRPLDPSATQMATVATDVATLVADGATPTQAHVTTLNTDWAVVNTALLTGAGFKVLIDNSIFTTKNHVMTVLAALAMYIQSDDSFS